MDRGISCEAWEILLRVFVDNLRAFVKERSILILPEPMTSKQVLKRHYFKKTPLLTLFSSR